MPRTLTHYEVVICNRGRTALADDRPICNPSLMAFWTRKKPRPDKDREHYGRTVSPAAVEAHNKARKKFNRRYFHRPG